MKKYILFLLITIISSVVSAQSWRIIPIGNGLMVGLPNIPKYTIKEKSSLYISKSKNCLFMIIVQFDQIPKFEDFLKLPSSQQEQIKKILLDNIIKGQLQYNNSSKKALDIVLGNFRGKELSINAVNPATGVIGQRFSRTYLIFNKIFNFQCWYLNENDNCEKEKNKFFKSIKIKLNSNATARVSLVELDK